MINHNKFKLDDSFVTPFSTKEVDWGPLGYITYKRTYADQLSTGYTEEWWQTCRRVTEMTYGLQKGHCKSMNILWSDDKAQQSAQEFYRRLFDFKFTPPGRGLDKMGERLLKIGSGECLNNCGFVSTKDIGCLDQENSFSEPFRWLMKMSMFGVGVGFDTRGAGEVRFVNELPASKKFIVEDSREGWSDYLTHLLESYVGNKSYPELDVSKVRPKGALISTFGGTASGPEALMALRDRLDKIYERSAGKLITSKTIVHIANCIGECVVAGGTRRSAEIAFGHPQDSEFYQIKDYENNPEASEWPTWASNNSIQFDGEPYITPEEAKELSSFIVRNGEPGLHNLTLSRSHGRLSEPASYKDKNAQGANPCVEQTLHNKELCCLVETYPSRHDSIQDYLLTLKYAYLYAKTVTLVQTSEPHTNAVMLKNRRIGCSMTGVLDAIDKFGVGEFKRLCQEGYSYLKELDEIYSDWLCVRTSIKLTSVKPSGSVSKLPGVREGVHESKGEYELQSIRIQDSSPLIPKLREHNYLVEEAVNEPNTVVAYFPAHYPGFRLRSMWEQLELAAFMQHWWADNQVSVTIDFDPVTEGPSLASALEMYFYRLKGVSFLPRLDASGYKQLPKTVVTKERHDEYKASIKPGMDLSTVLSKREAEDKFCDGGLCEVPL